MSWGWMCGVSTKASKRYMWRLLIVMIGYLLATFGTTTFVKHNHPHGFEVYLLALLPTIPVLCMLGVVALYLREEKDEFQRVLMVRSMLVAIAGVLGMNAYADFLRSYKAISALPPFTDFVTFWLLCGLVQMVQSMMNRGGRDE
jgi:cytochrome bd-type quinol oxidase subunit 2